MRLYIDSADRSAAETLLETGVFAGLTTNPTILQRAQQTIHDIPEIYRWARGAGAQEIFFQAWGETAQELTDRALRLRELGEGVVIKVPASREGTEACATLAAREVPTLLTAVYAPAQAMLASAAGADYIAPYLGKLGEAGRNPLTEVSSMQRLLTATGSDTRVLAASIRDLPSMVALAEVGVGHFTFGTAIAARFFDEPLTEAAVAAFDRAVDEMNS